MRMESLIHLAAGLPADRARQVLALAARQGDPSTGSGPIGPETLEEFTARAGAAFEHTMQPVCDAIVSALHGNLRDFQDLRILLPHLLRSVARNPELSDLLAYQLGKTFMDGLQEGSHPEDAP